MLQVSNKKRFEDDFGNGEVEKPNLSKSMSYQKLFMGNNDDFFTLGLSLAKNSIKLYTDLYSSNIVIASPLGLRNFIGTRGTLGYIMSPYPSLSFTLQLPLSLTLPASRFLSLSLCLSLLSDTLKQANLRRQKERL